MGEGPEGWGAVGAAARGRRGLIGWRQGGGCVDEGRKKAARGGYNPDPPMGSVVVDPKSGSRRSGLRWACMFPLFSDKCLCGPPLPHHLSLGAEGLKESQGREGGKGRSGWSSPFGQDRGLAPLAPKRNAEGGGWVEQRSPPLSSGVPPYPPLGGDGSRGVGRCHGAVAAAVCI